MHREHRLSGVPFKRDTSTISTCIKFAQQISVLHGMDKIIWAVNQRCWCWTRIPNLTFKVNMQNQPNKPKRSIATLPGMIICYSTDHHAFITHITFSTEFRCKIKSGKKDVWHTKKLFRAVLPHISEWIVESVESCKVIQQGTVNILSPSEVSKVFSGLSYTASIVWFASLGTCYAAEPYAVFLAIAPSTGSTSESDLSWIPEKPRQTLKETKTVKAAQRLKLDGLSTS